MKSNLTLIILLLLLSNSLSLDTQVLKVEGKIRENNENQRGLIHFEKPITEFFFFQFNGFKIRSKENPNLVYRTTSKYAEGGDWRKAEDKGNEIWLDCPINTLHVPQGKYEIISFFIEDLFGKPDYEFSNKKIEIDILEDKLSNIYLIDVTHIRCGVALLFDSDIDFIDIKKFKYLILYDRDMGNFVAHLNCISKKERTIICETSFAGAYHSDEHLVRNLPYEDTYIKADKNGFIYFYPWLNKKLNKKQLYISVII